MAHALYRLGRTAFRRWPVFLIGWLVVLIGIGAVAGTLSKPLSDKFTIPGIESEQAQTLQQELFPGAKDAFDQATGTVVVQAPAGEKLSDPANAAAVEDLLTDLRAAPQVGDPEQFVNPVDAAKGVEQQYLDQAKESGQPTEVARANAAAVSPLTEDGRTGHPPQDDQAALGGRHSDRYHPRAGNPLHQRSRNRVNSGSRGRGGCHPCQLDYAAVTP